MRVYDDAVPELPACVRIALWVTDAWAREADIAPALTAALPDIDAAGGDVGHLDLWRELGERALLVALPGPGHVSALTGLSPEALGAATEAQECLVAPTLGAVLVPTITTFGPATPDAAKADRGSRLDLTAYDASPVPAHRVEANSARNARRSLLAAVADLTRELERVGATPVDVNAAWSAHHDTRHKWALPERLPDEARAAIVLAAEVGRAASVGLAHSGDAMTSLAHDRRTSALRALERAADDALAEATNAAIALMAGWIPQPQ